MQRLIPIESSSEPTNAREPRRIQNNPDGGVGESTDDTPDSTRYSFRHAVPHSRLMPNRTGLAEAVEDLRETPTLTCYVDTSGLPHGPRGQRMWRAQVSEIVERIRERYADLPRVERDLIDRNVRRLELRLRGLVHAAKAPGWIVCVARGDVHWSAPLPTRVTTDFTWRQGIWLDPYVPLIQASAPGPMRDLVLRTVEIEAAIS
jgi:hypothetical protein